MLKKDAKSSKIKDTKDTKDTGSQKSKFFGTSVLVGAAAYIARTLPTYLETIRRDPHAATALAVTNIAHATGIVPSTVQRVVSEMGNILGSHSIGGLVLSDRSVTSDGVIASWTPGKNVRSIYLADIVRVIAGLLSRMQKEPKSAVLDIGSIETAIVPADFFKQKRVNLGTSQDVLVAVVAVLIALFIVSMISKPSKPKRTPLVGITMNNTNNNNTNKTKKNNNKTKNNTNKTKNNTNADAATGNTKGVETPDRISIDRNNVPIIDIDAMVREHLADIFVEVAKNKTHYLNLLDVKNDRHCISLVKAIRNADPFEAEEVAERLREIEYNNSNNTNNPENKTNKTNKTNKQKGAVNQLKLKLTKIVGIINRGLTLLIHNGGTSEKASLRSSIANFVHRVNSGIKSGVAKNIFMFNIKDDETKNIYSSIKADGKAMANSVKDLLGHFDYLGYVSHFMGSNKETRNFWENKTCTEHLTSRITSTVVRVINLLHNRCLKANIGCFLPDDFVQTLAYLVVVYSNDTVDKKDNNNNNDTRFKARYQVDRCYIAVLATTLLYSMSHIVLKKDIPDTIHALEDSRLPVLQFLGKVVKSYFEEHNGPIAR